MIDRLNTWHLVRTSDDVRQFPVWHTDWHWIVWTYRAVRSDARRRGMARYHAAAWARLSVVRLLLAGAAGHTIGPADTPLGRRRRTKTAAQPETSNSAAALQP